MKPGTHCPFVDEINVWPSLRIYEAFLSCAAGEMYAALSGLHTAVAVGIAVAANVGRETKL